MQNLVTRQITLAEKDNSGIYDTFKEIRLVENSSYSEQICEPTLAFPMLVRSRKPKRYKNDNTPDLCGWVNKSRIREGDTTGGRECLTRCPGSSI